MLPERVGGSAATETVDLLGVPVARLRCEPALSEVERLYYDPEPARIVYVNAHTLNLAARDPQYHDVLSSAALVLNDGSGVALAARLQGQSFPENLNGSDFNLRILELAARRGWPVFLLGARPGVAEIAAERLAERLPGLTIAGTRHGYIDADGHGAVADEIRQSGAGVLLVGMGNPLQERWLAQHLADTGCSLGVAVGAFIDFSAGVVPRAPQWMSQAGIEWLYRLRQEPRRLWRRYVLGNPAFVARVVRARLRPSA